MISSSLLRPVHSGAGSAHAHHPSGMEEGYARRGRSASSAPAVPVPAPALPRKGQDAGLVRLLRPLPPAALFSSSTALSAVLLQTQKTLRDAAAVFPADVDIFERAAGLLDNELSLRSLVTMYRNILVQG